MKRKTVNQKLRGQEEIILHNNSKSRERRMSADDVDHDDERDFCYKLFGRQVGNIYQNLKCICL